MSDTQGPREPDEIDALLGEQVGSDDVESNSTNDEERPVPEAPRDGGIDADREVDLGDGAPESDGAGTADTADQAEFDSPD